MMRAVLISALMILLCQLGFVTPVNADTAQQQYAMAASFYARGDWENAVTQFDQFIAKHPNNTQMGLVLFYRGEALLQLNKYQQAIRSFEKFVLHQSQKKYLPQAQFRIAECHFLNGEIQKANKKFEAFRAENSQHSLIPFCLPYEAEIALKQQDYSQAFTLYQQLLNQTDSNVVKIEALHGLAQSSLAQNKLEDAKKWFLQLEEASNNPLSNKNALELGKVEFQLANYRRALKRLQSISDQESEYSAQAKFWSANCYYQVRDWNQAYALLSDLIESKPQKLDLGEIQYLAARCLYQTNQLDDSAKLFKTTIEAAPQSPWSERSHYWLVQIALAANNDKDALALAKQLWKNYPEGKLALLLRNQIGKLYLDQNDTKQAIAILETPSNSIFAESKEELQRGYLLGIAYFSDKQFQATIDQLRLLKANRLSPNLQTNINHVLGIAHVELQQYNTAIPTLKASLKKETNQATIIQARLHLAICLAYTNQLEHAKTELFQVPEKARSEDYFSALHQIAALAFEEEEYRLAEDLFQQMADKENPTAVQQIGLTGLTWCQLSKASGNSLATIEKLIESKSDEQTVSRLLFRFAQARLETDKPLALQALERIAADYQSTEIASEALRELVEIYESQGQTEDAIIIYRKLLSVHPEKIDSAEIQYRLAWNLIDLKQADEGYQILLTLYQEYPESEYWADTTYRLAEKAFIDQQFDLSQQYLEAIFQADSETDVLRYAHFLSGSIAVVEKNWEQVISQMQFVPVIEASDQLTLMALYWVAESNFHLHQYTNSQTAFTELNNLVRGTNFEHRPLIHLRLAQLSAQQQDWETAKSLATKLKDEFPSFDQQYEADYLIARQLAREAKFTQARAAYLKVVQSPTGSKTETAAMAQWMIGETFFHQRNYAKAIEAYNRVSALFPYEKWQAGALLQIGKCYEISQQWQKANQYYEEVTKGFANSVFAEEAQQRLSVVRQRSSQAAKKENFQTR